MTDNKVEELPMKWWKFWEYFSFPVGIILSIISLSNYASLDLNNFGVIISIIDFIIIAFMCVTYSLFVSRHKFGFIFLMIYLFVSVAWTDFNSTLNTVVNPLTGEYDIEEIIRVFIVAYIVFCVIWIYPNYLYFKKRKYLFKGKEEKQLKAKSKREDDKTLKETVDNKKTKIIKICSVCNKESENSEGKYCVFCGGKLVKKNNDKAENQTKVDHSDNYKIYKTALIILIPMFLISSGLAIYFKVNDRTYELEKEIETLKTQVSAYKNTNKRLNDDNNSLINSSATTTKKLEFFDKNVVFVLDGYGRYYYTYDQMVQVTQGKSYTYWAYNLEQAIDLGYRAWK